MRECVDAMDDTTFDMWMKRVLKSNIPSFKAINSNGAYIADEDETHYFMRVKK